MSVMFTIPRLVSILDKLQCKISTYCEQEFSNEQGKEKVKKLIPKGNQLNNAVYFLSQNPDWNIDSTSGISWSFLYYFELDQVNLRTFLDIATTDPKMKIDLLIQYDILFNQSSSYVPGSIGENHFELSGLYFNMHKTGFHPSWTGDDSPYSKLLELIQNHCEDINLWINLCGEDIYKIYQHSSGTYAHIAWFREMLEGRKKWERFITMIWKIKNYKNQEEFTHFPNFWNSWIRLEILPYITGHANFSCLSHPRSEAPIFFVDEDAMQVDSEGKSTEINLEDFLKSANINSPSFIAEYLRLELDFENFGTVLQMMPHDPSFAILMRTISLNQRITLIRKFNEMKTETE
jgi:hypothetical protein